MIVDLHVVFVASPLGQGERIKVRGSSLAEAKRAENKPSPSPLPSEGRGVLAHRAYSIQLSLQHSKTLEYR